MTKTKSLLKQAFLVTVMLIMALSCCFLTGCFEKEEDENEGASIGLETVVGNVAFTCKIKGRGTFTGKDIKIPTYIDGYKVVGINSGAFQNDETLESIIIPTTVEEIGEFAFKRCENLTTVTLKNGLIEICEKAFQECSSLSSITFPTTLTKIGDYAFEKTALTNVTIPASVDQVGYEAFYNCQSLHTLTIKGRLIGSSAFRNCTALTTLNWEDTCTYISTRAFANTNLTKVIIPETVTDIGKKAFYEVENVTIYARTSNTAIEGWLNGWDDKSGLAGDNNLVKHNVQWSYNGN